MIELKKASQLDHSPDTVHCIDTLPLLESAVTMIVSQGGCGKSSIAIRLAMQFVAESNHKAALWLTEDTEYETYRRYNNLIPEFYIQGANKEYFNDRIAFITSPAIKFTGLKDGNAHTTLDFEKTVATLARYKMIVIDPLLQFNGCDENSNTHAGVMMGALKEWVAKEKKILLLLHHVTQTAGKDGQIYLKARGASDLQNSCRCVYQMTYPMMPSEHGPVPNYKSLKREMKMIKDNGLGYKYFMNDDNTKRRLVDVFPEGGKL